MILKQQRKVLKNIKGLKWKNQNLVIHNLIKSHPYRDDIEYLDIFEEGDEIVKGLEDMTGGKNMVTKDGTVINVSAEGKGVDEAFQKKIYKDIEGEEQIIPEPEHVRH